MSEAIARFMESIKVECKPVLDPGHMPMILFNRAYEKAVIEAGSPEIVVIALERENGYVERHETRISRQVDPVLTGYYLDRLVKFLLWSRGAWKVYLGGFGDFAQGIVDDYAVGGRRAFDADLMGRIYGFPFEVVACETDDLPDSCAASVRVGGHLDGCRIGFDLGASDFKLSAVIDGEAVFSTEIPWNPQTATDPDYHYNLINDGLKQAAEHLPRVDAIGGSTAGDVIDNRMRVASLFRSIPDDRYAEASELFVRIQKEWNVPVEVLNDGEVTALAGALSMGETGVLGIAMGSSEAAGYISREGKVAGWIDELAFAPVDANPGAPLDEWSGDHGVGAMYFSQQAVARLAPLAGIVFDEAMPLPERLKRVQAMMEDNEPAAVSIYRTIGVYLGYAIAHYADFYDIRNVLVLGRVLSGRGGQVIIMEADQVLSSLFPSLAQQINVRLPDEKSRRVGQSVAAASLPILRKSS